MNDLAMHILDIVQNSISAGARKITVRVDENIKSDILSIMIKDDGKGMSQETIEKVTDPYYTSRTTRKVGLGIPLLKQSAEQSRGSLSIVSQVGQGTEISASFVRSNIDRPPLGNIPNAFVLLVCANPKINMILEYVYDAKKYSISTEEIVEALDGMPVNSPAIVSVIEEMIKNNIDELQNFAH